MMRWKVIFAGFLVCVIVGIGYLAFDYQQSQKHAIYDWAAVVKHQGEIYSIRNMTLDGSEVKPLLGEKLGRSIDKYDEWQENGRGMPELASTHGVMDMYTAKGYPESQRIIGLREGFNGLEVAVFEKEDISSMARLLDNYKVEGNIKKATYQVKNGTYRTLDDTDLLEEFMASLRGSKERINAYFGEEVAAKNFIVHLKDNTNLAVEMNENGLVMMDGLEVQLKKDALFKKMYQALAGAQGDMTGDYTQLRYRNQDYAQWGGTGRNVSRDMVDQYIGTTREVSEETLNGEEKLADFSANVADKKIFSTKLYNDGYKLLMENAGAFEVLINNSMDSPKQMEELLDFKKIMAVMDNIQYESKQSWLFGEWDFREVADLEVKNKFLSALERAEGSPTLEYADTLDKRHIVMSMVDGNELELLLQEDGSIIFEDNYFKLAEQDKSAIWRLF